MAHMHRWPAVNRQALILALILAKVHGWCQVAGALLQHAARQQELAASLQGSGDTSNSSFRDHMSPTDSQQLSDLGQFLPILNLRVQDMEKLLHSHQAPSRVLRWLTNPS